MAKKVSQEFLVALVIAVAVVLVIPIYRAWRMRVDADYAREKADESRRRADEAERLADEHRSKADAANREIDELQPIRDIRDIEAEVFGL